MVTEHAGEPGQPGKPGEPGKGGGGTGGKGGKGGPGIPKGAGKELQSGLRTLAIATIALFLLLTGTVVYFKLDSNENRGALCALRGDLEIRVATSRAFLKEHPEGIPGIPTAAIRSGIENQQRTIDALSSLDC